MRFLRHSVVISILILASCPVVNGADTKEERYELNGRVLQEDGKPFRRVVPVVFLHSATRPFTIEKLAFPAGKFKFKKLEAGIYTLIAIVPYAGELRKTLEVGPSFADKHNRITTEVLFGPEATRSYTVSAVELSVPKKAKKEYEKAQDSLSEKKVEAAIEHLKKAVDTAPQYWQAWNNLGTIAYQTRRFSEAEDYFRRAHEQASDAYAPLVNLGGTLLTVGRIEASLPLNLEAAKMKPDDPLALAQLGQNYYLLGQHDEAEEYLKRAKALDPSHYTYPQLVLARIYAARQERAQAVSELREFLELHPDSNQAESVQMKIQDLLGRHDSIEDPLESRSKYPAEQPESH